MKKAAKSLLVLTLIMGLAMFSSVYGVASAAPEGEVHKVSFDDLKNSVLANSRTFNSYKQIIDKEGNTFVIYGSPVDRAFVYEHLLKDKNVPYLFGPNEFKKETKKKRVDMTPSIKINRSSFKQNPYQLSNKNQLKQYTTEIIIYNYQGELFVKFENYYIPKDVPLSKVVNKDKVKQDVMSDKIDNQIAKFQKYVQQIRKNHPQGKEEKVNFNDIGILSATLEGSVHDSGTIISTRDLTGVGYHEADYLIYNANDSDPNYDHLIIKADVTADPVNLVNPSFEGHTSGYQADFWPVYIEDSLIDWKPDTTLLSVRRGEKLGEFQIGYPSGITFAFDWVGADSVELLTEGSKSQGENYYINFWRSSISKAYPVAENRFGNEYAVMLKVDTLGGQLSEVEFNTGQSMATFYWEDLDSYWGSWTNRIYYNY